MFSDQSTPKSFLNKKTSMGIKSKKNIQNEINSQYNESTPILNNTNYQTYGSIKENAPIIAKKLSIRKALQAKENLLIVNELTDRENHTDFSIKQNPTKSKQPYVSKRDYSTSSSSLNSNLCDQTLKLSNQHRSWEPTKTFNLREKTIPQKESTMAQNFHS